MALRTLVRKLPALGGRSPPLAPRMGPVHALSPAACSRLMSNGGTGGQVVYSEEDEATLAKQQEEIKRMTAEFNQSMKEIQKNLDDLDEVERRSKEDYEKFSKKLNNIEKACNVALIVLVPTTILLLMSL